MNDEETIGYRIVWTIGRLRVIEEQAQRHWEELKQYVKPQARSLPETEETPVADEEEFSGYTVIALRA